MNRVALVGGVFDPVHAGHVAYLRAAQAHGELVCALSDRPDKHPPLVPLAHRVALLQALGVSRVLVHEGGTVAEIIRSVRPTAYVKGEDWRGALPADEIAACHEVGAALVFTTARIGSSSEMLADYERARNAQQLAAFERVVQTQRPASPWQPVTDYSRETRRQIEAPHADRLAEVFHGLTVLDYGCGYGYLAELLRERGLSVATWDPQYAPETPRLRSGVVICREVLEHVRLDRWPALLADLVRLASRYLYITTRFTTQPHLLDVETADDLDPTHISLVHQDLLRALLVLHGCRRRADLEATLDHQQKGRVLVYEVPA